MDPSSLIGIIWDATKCFCACATQEADLVFDLEDNLKLLENKRKKLEDMKKDVEANVEEAENSIEMQRSQQVDGWLQQVETIQQEIEEIQVHGAQEIQNRCLRKCCPRNCKSRYKLGKDVVKMIKNVDELSTEGKVFGQNFKFAHKIPPRAIEMPPDETVGLDSRFEKVWNSIEAENVGVIGLYGMGGVGKTTLLKKINNELGKRRLDFDIVMWVVVSREPNLDSIMNTIRKLIGIRDEIWNQYSNGDEKTAKLYGVLKQKRFVLLLDDIWERLDLKLVGVPHPKDTSFKSKVLFTTRVKDVCEKMQAQKAFKIGILTEKEAVELFCLKVGDETLKSHPYIPKLAAEMAKGCEGLPLALIVVGSAMAGVKSVEAWEHSKNNLTSSSWTAPNLETDVFSILKFSYDHLPDEVHKNCFLYCALYPEDYKISVSDVIDKWIAERFLCINMTNSMREMRCQGEFIIEKLKLLCLLENVDDDIMGRHGVKMHDVIRDMAIWLARDQDENKRKVLLQGDAFVMSQDDFESKKLVERISMMSSDESNAPIPPSPNVKTFLLNMKSFRIKELQNIQYMCSLKVLELRVNIPVKLCSLVLLEYLSLNGEMCTSEFFMMLKDLRNLKFLTLYGDLASSPLGVISSFQQLRMLKMISWRARRNSKEERDFLEEVESLSKIEESSITIKLANGLNKLLESTKLQSCIYNLRLAEMDTQIKMPLLLASMSKMKYLRGLHLESLSIVEDSSIFGTCCLSLLTNVSILQCDSVTHVTWLKYAPLLQHLVIVDCPSMEELVMKEEGTTYENEEYCMFSCLMKMFLSGLPKLKTIYETALSFPSLRSIKIVGCPNLKKLPFDSNSAKHKLRLIKGYQQWWDSLEWDDSATRDQFQSKFQKS